MKYVTGRCKINPSLKYIIGAYNSNPYYFSEVSEVYMGLDKPHSYYFI